MNDPTLDKKIMMACPDCDGDGELLSDCCGASKIGNGDNDSIDYGICPECGDHCSFNACETCVGTGEVEMNEDEIIDLKNNIEFEQ
jgi:hypothetical protein